MKARGAFLGVLLGALTVLIITAVTGNIADARTIAGVGSGILIVLVIVPILLWWTPRARKAVGLDPHWEWYRLRAHAPPPRPLPPAPTSPLRGVPVPLIVGAVGGLTTSLITIVALSLAIGEPVLITIWLGFALPVVIAAPFVVRHLRRQHINRPE